MLRVWKGGSPSPYGPYTHSANQKYTTDLKGKSVKLLFADNSPGG